MCCFDKSLKKIPLVASIIGSVLIYLLVEAYENKMDDNKKEVDKLKYLLVKVYENKINDNKKEVGK